MKKLTLALTVMLFGVSAFAQNTNVLLSKYISVKNALINGDDKTASQAAGALYQSVKNEEPFAQKDELLKATDRLSQATGLEKKRASFNDVSIIMWKLIKNSGKLNQAVYYQYCPMKKAYWLSNEKEVKNPYFGSSMLTCGKVVETK